nr:MAG: hypothetical protein 1 [Leviviridae sp.]
MSRHVITTSLSYGDVKVIGRTRDWINSPYPYVSNVTEMTEESSGRNDSWYSVPDRTGRFREGYTWLARSRRYQRSFGDHLLTYRLNAGPAYEGTYRISQTYVNSFMSSLIPTPSDEDIREACFEFGAEAYNKIKPDAPLFEAALSLAELREALPSLKDLLQTHKQKVRKEMKRRKRLPGQLSAELHIANEFGWKPLFQMIVDYINALNKKKKAFDQLLRDEGKPVYRRRVIRSGNDPVTTVHLDNYVNGYNNPNLYPILVTQCYPPGRQYRNLVFSREREIVWAVGRSRYILPKGRRNKKWERMIKRRLMGGYLTPSQVYNMIPWSWLVDYFTGLGNFAAAISEGVAAQVWFEYAYVMRQTETTLAVQCQQHIYTSKVGATKNMYTRSTAHEITRARVVATPFGWGLSDDSLSSYQWGILGALGYSRLPSPL